MSLLPSEFLYAQRYDREICHHATFLPEIGSVSASLSFEQEFSIPIIKSGFKKCGIYPDAIPKDKMISSLHLQQKKKHPKLLLINGLSKLKHR